MDLVASVLKLLFNYVHVVLSEFNAAHQVKEHCVVHFCHNDNRRRSGPTPAA
jgi:hypothetical protein